MAANEDNLMEINHAALEAKQARTDARLEALQRDVEMVASSVQDLTAVIRDTRTTPWNNIIAAVGVAFTILAAIFSIVISNQAAISERLDRNIRQVHAQLVDHERLKAHPVAIARLDGHERELTAFAERLRSLDDTLLKEIDGLSRLGSQLQKVDARVTQMQNGMDRRLITVEQVVRTKVPKVSSEIARLDAFLKDLKQEVEKLRVPGTDHGFHPSRRP